MTLILTFLFMFNLAVANDGDEDVICEETYSVQKDNIQDISKVLTHDTLKVQTPYYFYFEGKELEDLQTLKNCIDYTQCGKYQESIVDDPSNYRLHLWKSMGTDELTNLIRTCPIPDIASKLVVRTKDQKGKIINLKGIKTFPAAQIRVSQKANPAIFHEPSQAVSIAMVNSVTKSLAAGKINDAHKTILYTWGIDLHGYKLNYSGQPGDFAVTNHGKKTIGYGKAWLSDSCDFIRMIRHEAEHAAQMKMAKSCGEHNFDDHNKRERAAHLNDARFMKNVCANSKAGETVRKFCLERFRKNYMNK